MKVEVKTSNMTGFVGGEMFRMGDCLHIDLPTKVKVTVRLSADQWKLAAQVVRAVLAQEGLRRQGPCFAG